MRKTGSVVLSKALTILISVSTLALPLRSQHLPPAHEATVGVIVNDGGERSWQKVYLVDLKYSNPTTGLPEVYGATFTALGQPSPPSFLKSGTTYAAHIWIEFNQFLHINLQYGGAHFVDQLRVVETRNCNNTPSLLSALTNGREYCEAGDGSQASFQWHAAIPVEDLSLREQFDFNCAAYRFDLSDQDDPMLPDSGDQKIKNARHEQEKKTYVAKLAQLVQQLQPAPEIPERAHKEFVEGATRFQGARSWQDLFDADGKFDDAILEAPWWKDAYYNDARVKEKMGLYDDASVMLNQYLCFPLAAADARDARDRLYAIEAEKEGDKKDRDEFLREAAAKYVKGGAQRVLESDAPQSWQQGIEDLYTYRQNLTRIDRYFLNVFRMPNGHYLAIELEAVPTESGTSPPDRILLAELETDGRAVVREYSFGTLDGRFLTTTGSDFQVSISNRQSDGIVSVTDPQSGAGIVLPIADLYSARYTNVVGLLHAGYYNLGGEHYSEWVEGGKMEGGRNLSYAFFFSDKLDAVHGDPLSLTPTYVVQLGHDTPIADTGYLIRYHGDIWKVEK